MCASIADTNYFDEYEKINVMTGPRCDGPALVASYAPKQNALTAQETADGWLVQIPEEKENILKEGQWNQMRILVKGDRVQTWLNGQQMVDITDAKIGAGHGRIALQIHDGGGIKVRWRNIHIKTL